MTPQLAAQLAAMVLTAAFIVMYAVFLTLVFERDDQAVPEVQENEFWPLAPIPALCLPAPLQAPLTRWCVTDQRPAPMPAR